jgi:hypothetical protein
MAAAGKQRDLLHLELRIADDNPARALSFLTSRQGQKRAQGIAPGWGVAISDQPSAFESPSGRTVCAALFRETMMTRRALMKSFFARPSGAAPGYRRPAAKRCRISNRVGSPVMMRFARPDRRFRTTIVAIAVVTMPVTPAAGSPV